MDLSIQNPNGTPVYFLAYLAGGVLGIISTISISASSLPPNELVESGQCRRLLLLNDSANSWVSVPSALRLGNWLKRVVSSWESCVADNWSNDRWSSTQTTSLVNWPACACARWLTWLLLLARARWLAADEAADPSWYPVGWQLLLK